ncbi:MULTISPECIES: amidohydrolase family protein [unclassified Rhizobium]|uniref:N-acetylglucosamine-6-phosphate deacetylase n=1 Tax=unclassified Rhizobium TaxID=2613769 RepID=UPI001AE39F29|nr:MULTISPECIES: amidohydrolase family protein [unclassified Rhizobium]MBP2463898.1 N-acetylglucosamine-6-phosphate deacetylase [Rhizobium sp. PvP014]MBP2532125.1 N-acetylglucosamine-6-phosphate deacetylase [Rhizobium sp. PvP099]
MAIVDGIDPRTGKGILVEIADGTISAIRPTEKTATAYLSAGLVDLQVNGFRGLDLNAGAVTSSLLLSLCKELLSVGVTTWLPTLITASEASITQALEAIAASRAGHQLIADMVPGVHVEGPSISDRDGPRGAHPLAHVRPPSIAEFDRWQRVSGGLVSMVTLAPEHDGTLDYIRALTARGVIVALGHTAATPEQIHAAAEAGATLSTHLGNGAAATLPRHPNFIWAQLADDRLTASFIADGWHLPADTFKAMLRAKGMDRAILVSDMVALAGMPPGLYRQPVGGDVEVSPEGRIGVAGTPYLAGASLPLSANVAMAAEMAGIPLADALLLATANPGRLVRGRGRLEVGARADLIRFGWPQGNRNINVRETWVHGEKVFGR